MKFKAALHFEKTMHLLVYDMSRYQFNISYLFPRIKPGKFLNSTSTLDWNGGSVDPDDPDPAYFHIYVNPKYETQGPERRARIEF
jgi:hypothetical protein